MKTLSLLFGLLLFKIVFCAAQTLGIRSENASGSPAQSSHIRWSHSFGGTGNEITSSMIATKDGGYVTAGYSNSTDGDVTNNHGGYDYWIVKLDSKGILQWQHSYGGSNDDKALHIEQTKDGGFVVGGTSESNDGDVTGNHGSLDYWIIKLNENGDLQWEKPFGGSDQDNLVTVYPDHDGGYFAVGSTYSNDGDITGFHGVVDFWAIKLDENGNLLWEKTFGGTSTEYVYFSQMTSDNNFVIGGTSASIDGDVTGHHGVSNEDYWIVKLNSKGDLLWEKALGGTEKDHLYSGLETSDNGFVLAGFTYSDDGDVTGAHEGTDYWIVKLDSTGTLQWENALGGSQDEQPFSVKQANDGSFYINGFTDSKDGDVTGSKEEHYGFTTDYWVVKLDPLGNLLWEKCLGGKNSDNGTDLQVTADGGSIAYGYASSGRKSHGGWDYFIDKLSASGKSIYKISLGGSSHEYPSSLIPTSDGGFTIAGYSYSVDDDITDHHGTISTSDFWVVNVAGKKAETENNFSDEHNFVATKSFDTSNNIFIFPTITSSTFEINLKTTTTDQLVNIEVFNAIGQLILSKQTEMIHGILEAKIELNPLLPGGMYFVKTSLSNQQYVGKILLARDR